jgi:hypothetical protein
MTMEIAGATFHLGGSIRNAYGLPAKIDAESLLQRLLDAGTWRTKPIAVEATQVHNARTPVRIQPAGTRAIGRTRLLDLFAAAKQGATPLSRQFVDDANERLKREAYIEIPFEGAAPQFRIHVHIDDMDSFCALLALLLANPEGRAMIGQCKQCQRFFFVPRKRDGQRDYCSSDCRGARHDGADRKRKQRAVGVLEKKKYDRDQSDEAVERAIKQYPEEKSFRQLAEYAQAIIDARKHK